MSFGSVEDMSKQELLRKIEMLESKLILAEQGLEREQREMKELIKFGASLLEFTAFTGLFLRHLELESSTMNIAEVYLILLKELYEIGRLTELQQAENGLEGDVLEIVKQQPLKRTGLSPLAFVTGVKYGLDVLGE